jgi:hypothetical protein
MINLSDEAIRVRLEAVRNCVDAGPGPGFLMIYAGPVPNSTDDTVPPRATLLAKVGMTKPSAGAADGASGKITFTPSAGPHYALATGRAEWARLCTSHGAGIMRLGSIGTRVPASLCLDGVDLKGGEPFVVHDVMLLEPE